MILDAARNGATKSGIINGTSLTQFEVDEYLEFLQQKSLVGFEPSTGIYWLSAKGGRCLQLYDSINDLCTMDGVHIAKLGELIVHQRTSSAVSWDKAELIDRMRDIISP